METKIESKIGKIASSSERVYNFFSDFRNFSRLIPPDKIKNWQADENSCKFTADTLGDIGLQIIEKEPYSLVKITSADESKFNFFFWVQLKEADPYDTRIRLTIKVDLNPMMKMMAQKPLQNFVDTLVDQLEKIPF